MGIVTQFAQIIRQRRLEKGITQEQLSRLVWEKPNRPYIMRLETDRLPNITLNTIDKILVALDLDLEIQIYQEKG